MMITDEWIIGFGCGAIVATYLCTLLCIAWYRMQMSDVDRVAFDARTG